MDGEEQIRSLPVPPRPKSEMISKGPLPPTPNAVATEAPKKPPPIPRGPPPAPKSALPPPPAKTLPPTPPTRSLPPTPGLTPPQQQPPETTPPIGQTKSLTHLSPNKAPPPPPSRGQPVTPLTRVHTPPEGPPQLSSSPPPPKATPPAIPRGPPPPRPVSPNPPLESAPAARPNPPKPVVHANSYPTSLTPSPPKPVTHSSSQTLTSSQNNSQIEYDIPKPEKRSTKTAEDLKKAQSADDVKKLEKFSSKSDIVLSESKPKSQSVRVKKPKFGLSVKNIFGKKENIYQDRLAEYFSTLQNDSKTDGLFNALIDQVETLDTWTSKKKEHMDWGQVEDLNAIPQDFTHLLDLAKCQPEGFRFEFGKNDLVDVAPEIMDLEKNIPFFQDNLFGKELISYVNDGSEDKTVGPVCLVFEKYSENGEKKAILYTKKADERLFVDADDEIPPKEVARMVKQLYPDTVGKVKLSKILDQDINQKYVDFEKSGIITRYKIGILYAKEGQTTDDEMFSNGGTDTPSEDYQQFLQWIGTIIQLKGHDKYRGGLDVKNDTTGTQSVYTNHKGFEIMFHVSTLLPFQPDDLQRVERKRHLGNDMVMIVFKEGKTPFNPGCIATQFIHCFIVIEPVKVNGKTHYRIAIANKPGVPPYGPFLKHPPLYEKNDALRELLLTKIINAERAAMYAPDFKLKMIRTRNQQLEGYTKEFLEKKEMSRGLSFRNSGEEQPQPTNT